MLYLLILLKSLTLDCTILYASVGIADQSVHPRIVRAESGSSHRALCRRSLSARVGSGHSGLQVATAVATAVVTADCGGVTAVQSRDSAPFPA